MVFDINDITKQNDIVYIHSGLNTQNHNGFEESDEKNISGKNNFKIYEYCKKE